MVLIISFLLEATVVSLCNFSLVWLCDLTLNFAATTFSKAWFAKFNVLLKRKFLFWCEFGFHKQISGKPHFRRQQDIEKRKQLCGHLTSPSFLFKQKLSVRCLHNSILKSYRAMQCQNQEKSEMLVLLIPETIPSSPVHPKGKMILFSPM